MMDDGAAVVEDGRAVNATMEVGYTSVETSLGRVVVAGTGRGLCMVVFDDGEAVETNLRRRVPNAAYGPAEEGVDMLAAGVVTAIETPGDAPTLPVDPQGTAFERRVWAALREIPVGETRTYTALAEAIGQPKAARAVARACARNTIAVAVPCHRIVRASRALGGYRWGVDRKRSLLARERARLTAQEPIALGG